MRSPRRCSTVAEGGLAVMALGHPSHLPIDREQLAEFAALRWTHLVPEVLQPGTLISLLSTSPVVPQQLGLQGQLMTPAYPPTVVARVAVEQLNAVTERTVEGASDAPG